MIRRSKGDNLYETSCTICRFGIYQGQPATWTRGIYLGRSHEACAVEKGLVPR